MVAEITRTRAQELLPRLADASLYREAYKAGMSLTAFLEREDPSAEYKDGLDAFGRVLKAKGIVTRAIPEIGLYADPYERFFQDPESRALLPEWWARQWRSVTMAPRPQTRAMFLSMDSAIGNADNPWTDDAMGRWNTDLAPAIPLSELVAMTTPIDGDGYRAFYLTDSAAQTRLVRVSEGAEIPRMKLTGTDRFIRTYKYGRALEASYEQLRRARIDKVALIIRRMAIRAEVDKVATVLDVLVNGDGNANTAAENFDLTTLDSGASAGTLTLKAWLAFKRKFASPYMVSTALMTDAVAGQLELLNVGSANVQLVTIAAQSGFGGLTAINPTLREGVRYGWTSDAPANKIVGFDRRLAIERVTEIGADISEVERVITRQTQIMTMTEVEGYAVFDQDAAKTLNIAA